MNPHAIVSAASLLSGHPGRCSSLLNPQMTSETGCIYGLEK